MAISTNFKAVESSYDQRQWRSIDEYEDYYLKRIQETVSDANYYTDRNGIEKLINHINHFPELKEYEVWSEGYSATGEQQKAYLVGKAMARNFAQACDIVMCKGRLEWIEKCNAPDYKGYCPPRTWDYNPSKLSDWGCRLFWNKELASKSFG